MQTTLRWIGANNLLPTYRKAKNGCKPGLSGQLKTTPYAHVIKNLKGSQAQQISSSKCTKKVTHNPPKTARGKDIDKI